MEIKRLRILSIFNTTINLNPTSMKDIFKPKINARVPPNNMTARHHNSATYGDKRLITSGRH